MNSRFIIAFSLALIVCAFGCAQKKEEPAKSPAAAKSAPVPARGVESVSDDVSQKTVVKIALESKDHTTLVAALQAADLVTSLANQGPFTVFAPTNAAFEKLPKGTVEELTKPENKNKLRGILYHHVLTSALATSFFKDGQEMNMFDGTPVKFSRKGNDLFIGEAKVLGSVRGSNGWVHIIDGVVLPPAK